MNQPTVANGLSRLTTSVCPVNDIAKRVEVLIRYALELDECILLDWNSDLVGELGVDSLRAFEVLCILHTLLGTRIPKNLTPNTVATIHTISSYVTQFPIVSIERLMAADIPAAVRAMRAENPFG